MPDRTLILAGTIPLIAGVVLLLVLSRVPPATQQAAAPAAADAAGDSFAAAESAWVGVVVAASTAELAATASGRVEAVFVRTGDSVEKGAELLRFDRSDVDNSIRMANARVRERSSAVASAQARVRAAQKRLDRLRQGEAWLSKQELDVAVEELGVAKAELAASRATVGASRAALKGQRIRSERQTLVAPFAGRVVAVDADVGDSVSPGQVMLRILSEERQVRFAFPPGELSPDTEPQVSVHLQGADASVVTTVEAVRPEVDPSAQLVFATAPLPESLQDSSLWIPGAPVAVARVVHD